MAEHGKTVYRYVVKAWGPDHSRHTVRVFRTNDVEFAERVIRRDEKTHGGVHVTRKVSSSPMQPFRKEVR